MWLPYSEDIVCLVVANWKGAEVVMFMLNPMCCPSCVELFRQLYLSMLGLKRLKLISHQPRELSNAALHSLFSFEKQSHHSRVSRSSSVPERERHVPRHVRSLPSSCLRNRVDPQRDLKCRTQ